jgi:hypothetical protein
MSKKKCMGLQESIGWCEGTPEPAGIRRRSYYISMADCLDHPKIPVDEDGRPTSSILTGQFVLAADKTFKYIDFLPEKSQFQSDPQGDYPNQTQLDKLNMVHPGVGPVATNACVYINNTRCFFLFQDKKGRWRLVGNPDFESKNTVAQDLGQGVTGSTSTTIAVEASNLVSAPFFNGVILTEEGEINITDDEQPEPAA